MRPPIRLAVALLVLALPAVAAAQVSHVQTVSGSANDVVLNISAPADNFLCFVLANVNSDTQTLSIADNGSPSIAWAAVPGSPWTHSAANVRIYAWSAPCAGSPTTITLTSSGSGTVGGFFGEFAWSPPPGAVDRVAIPGESSGTSQNIIGTVSPSAADALLVALSASSTAATFTLDGDWTRGSWTDQSREHGRYRIVSSLSAYAAPATSAASETALTVMVAFVGGTGAPGCKGGFFLRGIGC
jgi:hypothetical protein